MRGPWAGYGCLFGCAGLQVGMPACLYILATCNVVQLQDRLLCADNLSLNVRVQSSFSC